MSKLRIAVQKSGRFKRRLDENFKRHWNFY